MRAALGRRCVALGGFGFAANVSRRLPWLLDGERPRAGRSILPLTERGGSSARDSKVPIGSMPGPTLLRGARAAGLGGAGAGNWLWRLVRKAMLVVGAGIAVLSVKTGGPAAGDLEGFVVPGLRVLDWLKRRMNELLRDGRVSVWAAANGCMFDTAAAAAAVLGGAVLLKLPGAGKSLRLGS